LLRVLASIQTSPHKERGYRGAAGAVMRLDDPLLTLRQADGTLRKIAAIGPSSARIVAEVLAHTVAAYAQLDAAVARLRAAEDLEDALANVLSAVEEDVAAGRGALAAVNEAQRDLFDARVGVVDAVRDRILAVFNVLRMIGRLSPAALGIAG